MTTAIPELNLLSPPAANPLSLLPASPLAAPPAPAAPVAEEEPREFGDVLATRRSVYDNVLTAARTMQPTTSKTHTLRLVDVNYVDPDSYRIKDQKTALLSGRSQDRRLQGTWELVDNATGQVLDSLPDPPGHLHPQRQ
jgi:hypothetical protein